MKEGRTLIPKMMERSREMVKNEGAVKKEGGKLFTFF
jgi:hypothetical protein